MEIYNESRKYKITSQENWVKCGKCGTEFDLNKNNGCPLCGFGSKKNIQEDKAKKEKSENKILEYLSIPNDLVLEPGKPLIDDETRSVGSWGMFNSFFPGKATLRVLAHLMEETNQKYVRLSDLMNKMREVLQESELTKLRGFPNNTKKESSIGRLVYHFIRIFTEMGFFIVKTTDRSKEDVWACNWEDIEITLTKEGLEFAKIKNRVFDYNESNQVLTLEEKTWLIDYLKKIDREGYKEYSILKDVFEFLKEGHNGKDELWNWFKNNENFRNYVKQWSRKADDPEAFEKQIENISTTFAAGKLALLRELGIVKNKRNDYTILEELK